jgi:hypothetical protein
VTFEEMEKALRRRLQDLPTAACAELLHVLMLPDFERVEPVLTQRRSRSLILKIAWRQVDVETPPECVRRSIPR